MGHFRKESDPNLTLRKKEDTTLLVRESGPIKRLYGGGDRVSVWTKQASRLKA